MGKPITDFPDTTRPWHVGFTECVRRGGPGSTVPCRTCGCTCGGYRRDIEDLCWRCGAAFRPGQIGLGL